MNYYNESDPFAATWLRDLIAAKLIPHGVVDERSISDVQPEDIKGYTQCHFFAGIGGWSRALQLARWPEDRPIWTGSPPCQPYSNAGKGKGQGDHRHLWPEFFRLIRERQPAIICGEQVASAIAHGWWDLVQNDLEGEGYAAGMVVLPACSVGAPHLRQRMWFFACSVGDANIQGSQQRSERPKATRHRHTVEPACSYGGMANPISQGSERNEQQELQGDGWGIEGRTVTECSETPDNTAIIPDALHGFWKDADWLSCRDGKWRPIKPGTAPLVNGVSSQVGHQLRGYGNAIVPQVGAEIIKSFMEYDQ